MKTFSESLFQHVCREYLLPEKHKHFELLLKCIFEFPVKEEVLEVGSAIPCNEEPENVNIIKALHTVTVRKLEVKEKA